MDKFLLVLLISISFLASKLNAQQLYSEDAVLDCLTPNGSATSPNFLYTCNGEKRSCQSFLIFRSQSPYTSVTSIAKLFSTNPLNLSGVNNVSETEMFHNNQEVIVPVNCSCWKQYYQANSSYVVQPNDNYYTIATTIYEGLSTCSILMLENIYPLLDLAIGAKILVPMRCACPNRKQILDGTKFLLTYLVAENNTVIDVCERFNASISSVVYANGFSDENENITPMTTILIPLSSPPLSNQTIVTLSTPPPSNQIDSPPTASSTNSSTNKTWLHILIGALGGGFLVLFISIIVFCILFTKPRKKILPGSVTGSLEAIEKQTEKDENDKDTKEFLDCISTLAQSLKVYKFDELISATNYFSHEYCIKGSVYRGNFNGVYAAIKVVDSDATDEITLLTKISHFNLICLLGVCFDRGHWYLIYEYAYSGSLSDWLYSNNDDDKFLSWTQRMRIALDVAMGLSYLHNYISPPYVHKDVSSSNVLLDSDLRAKIANFGLSRSAEKGQSDLTRHIVGTQGYMAPEYMKNGLISTKLDVYAFGILMLELITGKEALVLHKGNDKTLSEILTDVVDEKNGNLNLSKFMDFSMEGDYPTDVAVFVVGIVQNCIRRDQSSRPGMDEIVQSLSRILNAR